MNSFKDSSGAVPFQQPGEQSELASMREILRKLPIFAHVPLDIVNLFALLVKRVFYREGACLYRSGDRAKQAYLILSGTARMVLHHQKKVCTIQTLGPMDFFGEMALLADFERIFTVEALSTLEVLLLERSGFQKVMEQYPVIGMQVLERIIQTRMNRLHVQIRRSIESLESGEPLIRFEDWIGM